MKNYEIYPYSLVFYKTDDSQGWNMASMNGNKIEVDNKCSAQNWFKYEIIYESKCTHKQEDKLKYYETPGYIHCISNWIYWQELDKWFIPENELLPYPQKDCDEADDIAFHYSFKNFDGIAHVEVNVAIEPNIHQYVESICIVSAICDELEDFIYNLKTNKFAILNIGTFTAHKYIAWEKGDKIRFMVHDYNNCKKEYIPITVDVLLDKETFYTQIDEFYSKLKLESTRS